MKKEIINLIEKKYGLKVVHPDIITEENISYLLEEVKNIPKIDPEKHRKNENKYNILLFYVLGLQPFPEKFEHYYISGDYPDFDLDVNPDERERVIQYLKDEYGNCYNVVTFHTMYAKSSIQDACRYYEIEPEIFQKITNTIKVDIHNPERNTLEYIEENNEYVKELFSQRKEIRDLAYELYGRIRQYGTHASALVVSKYELPIIRTSNKYAVCIPEGTNIKSLNRFGIYKFDLLGLRNLTIIQNTSVKENFDYEDPEIYKYLNKEKKLEGIFMFNTSLSKMIIDIIKPDNFDELCAVNALMRPVCLQNKLHYEFANRKKGKIIKKGVEQYKHIFSQKTKENLEKTYYIPVYQEQIQQIVSDVLGVEFDETNKLRKIMSKPEYKRTESDKKILEEYKKVFSDKGLDELWEIVCGNLGYGFNMAHAYSYTYISVYQLFLKMKYPLQYYCSLLNEEPNTKESGKENKFCKILYECRSMVLPVNINISDYDCKIVSDNKILLGFKTIPGIGKSTYEKIIKNRPYNHLGDFLRKNKKINKNLVSLLIYASCFGGDKKDLLKMIGEEYRLEEEYKKLNFVWSDQYTDFSQKKVYVILRDKVKVGNKYKYVASNGLDEIIIYSKNNLETNKFIVLNKIEKNVYSE